MILSILEVLFLGFICGLIPGPVVTAIFAETVRSGWRAARRIVAWAALGESLMSIICVASLSLLNPQSIVFAVLSACGTLILLNLSWSLWKVQRLDGDEPLFTNRRVFMLSILNGMAWLFWITVCVPRAMALDGVLPGGRWLFIVLFELGWIAATLFLCYLFGFFRPYFLAPGRLHLFYRAVSLLFVLFAIKLAIGSAQVLLQ